MCWVAPFYTTDSIDHNFARIRIDSYDSLPMTFHDVIILIKSVVNKNKNSYYYNKILEEDSYSDKSDTRHFKMNVCIL